MSSKIQTSLGGRLDQPTSRLGIGMATLMREGSRPKREKAFDMAWEAGFRYVDVAPLYGLGKAERELGRLLVERFGITVGTKFGISPGRRAAAFAGVQGPLRRAVKYSKILRKVGQRALGDTTRSKELSADDVVRSLARSCEEIGVPKVDLFLCHDLPWASSLRDVLTSTEVRAKASLVGVAGEAALLASYPADFLSTADVIQTPMGGRSGAGLGVSTPRIGYGLLSARLLNACKMLDSEPSKRSTIENALDSPLRTTTEIAAALFATSLATGEFEIALLGSTDGRHFRDIYEQTEILLPRIENLAEYPKTASFTILVEMLGSRGAGE